MQENLVIVESPAKAKTIEKFLGKEFVVKSSYGHIRDLAKKDLGIDMANGFSPTYVVDADKKKVVAELMKLAKDAKVVWLASDEDREGEAIAWHLTQVLDLPVDSTRRIVFHEITKSAILHAVENPRTVDMNLVNAQQARRVLDRIVGFELSPVLWKKVKPSLSAGRVQSVAVRLLVEREREIIAFSPSAFWRVTAEFHLSGDAGATIFKAELNRRFDTRKQAEEFLTNCVGARYNVSKTEQKPTTKSPVAPFTTSTLQQEAGRRLSLSVSQTMSTAQKLYEAGFITYMRTDSVHLSSQAMAAAKVEIIKEFGEKYSHPRNFTTKSKGAQEAHEAIRPSYMDKATIEGTPIEKRLYDLIRKRTLASQMASAEILRSIVNIDIDKAPEHYVATGEVILFDGFLRLYSETSEEQQETGQGVMPSMKVGDPVEADKVLATERFTQSPPRYSEAALVRRLEELGIGRPSTYAPTITTIINRGYVVKQSREGNKRDYVQLTLAKDKVTARELTENVGKESAKLCPTDTGMLVNDYLAAQFPEILDYNFTAKVEKQFDDIAEGRQDWSDMMGEFYGPFHKTVEQALETAPQRTNNERILGIDPATGREVSARIGRYGPMVQIAAASEEEKPRFASLKKGQLIASLTLEEALALFALPRTVGQHEEKDVVIGVGKFGPYARWNGMFASLAKSDDPYTVTLERAVQLLDEKSKGAGAGSSKVPLKTFAEDPDIQILKGRYGPYIASKGKNYRIPTGVSPEDITIEECRAIIAKKG